MTLSIDTIRSREAMDALREEWEVLRATDPDRSPFLSYDWFRCCFEDAEGAEPYLLAVRSGDRLVGVAPLFRRRAATRWGAARSLEFIRCRETAYADLVVDPSRRDEVIDAIYRHLLSEARDAWDLLVLGPWPDASPNAATARRVLRALGARWTEQTASLAPVVAIDRDWESYWGTRSYLFRKSRRGILNRMERLGAVEVVAYREDASGDALRAVFRVADRAWKQERGIAMTSRPESTRFFEALTSVAGKRRWLLLWVLRLNGAPIAIEYQLTENGVVYALRADFDQEYRAHSPGAFLEYHILQRLFSEGYRAYNAGPGFDAYKLRWTEQVRRNVTVTVYNGGARNTLRWVTEAWALPRLRRLRDRVRAARSAPDDSERAA